MKARAVGSRTKAKSPQTKGICERFHRTIQDEFYAIAYRKKVYSGLGELQKGLDLWLENYTPRRPHSGKYCFGKTPYQTFLETIPLAKEKMLHNLVEAPCNIFFSEPVLTPSDEGVV